MKDLYFVMPMPVDASGRGPADEADTVRLVWEVWDECFRTVGEYPSLEAAEAAASRLNESPPP